MLRVYILAVRLDHVQIIGPFSNERAAYDFADDVLTPPTTFQLLLSQPGSTFKVEVIPPFEP